MTGSMGGLLLSNGALTIFSNSAPIGSTMLSTELVAAVSRTLSLTLAMISVIDIPVSVPWCAALTLTMPRSVSSGLSSG